MPKPRPESSGYLSALDSGFRRNDAALKGSALKGSALKGSDPFKGVKKSIRGFTLIEMITVIVLLGIIAGILTPFIAKAMQAYTHSKARAVLVAKGRLALERLAREVHQAAPNSLTVLAGTGIEFARTRAGGRYVERFDDFGTEFSDINFRFRKNFDLSSLYTVGTGLAFAASDVLVIGNTSPAELQAGNSSAALAGVAATTVGVDGTSNGQILSFAVQQFTVESPGKHFSIVDQTVEVGLDGGNNLRWSTAIGLTNYNGIANWGGGDPSLTDGVSAVSFAYTPGTPQSTGVLRVDLEIADATTGESIRLYREIHVRNTP